MTALRDVVFVGASTSFAEISEVVHDCNTVDPRYRIVALLDDAGALHGTTIRGVPVVGGLDMAGAFPDALFVFGIGSFRTRMLRATLLQRLAVPEDRYLTLVHPGAKVYPDATIGAGCIVHFGAVVAGGAELEPFAITTFHAIVGPGVRVRRCAMVASAAVLLTDVDVGAGAFVGAAACVAERVRIGPGAMIGMGTHVYRDVHPGAYVLGSPPRELSREPVPDALLSAW